MCCRESEEGRGRRATSLQNHFGILYHANILTTILILWLHTYGRPSHSHIMIFAAADKFSRLAHLLAVYTYFVQHDLYIRLLVARALTARDNVRSIKIVILCMRCACVQAKCLPEITYSPVVAAVVGFFFYMYFFFISLFGGSFNTS